MVIKLQRDADGFITCKLNSAAATDESTPPDIATTTHSNNKTTSNTRIQCKI